MGGGGGEVLSRHIRCLLQVWNLGVITLVCWLHVTVQWSKPLNRSKSLYPRVQTWSRLLGTVLRGLIFFMTDRPTLSSNASAFRGQSRLSGFCCANRLCVRSPKVHGSPSHHNSRLRTFDENSCAISITSPRSLFRPRTHQVWWDHREKSWRASTLWDCRGKSRLPGKVPANGT